MTKNVKYTGFIILVAILGYVVVKSFAMPNKPSNQVSGVEEIEIPTTLRTVYKTNSWFSSLYQFPSSPFFAYPAAYQISDKGLGISVPQIKGTEKTVYGSYDDICVLGKGAAFEKSSVIGYGDWNVELLLGDDLKFSFVQGSPVTYFEGLKDLEVNCRGAKITVLENSILITRDNGILLLQSSEKFSADLLNEQSFKISSESTKWRVSVLPDSSENTITLFENNSWNRILNTEISFAKSDVLQTNWNFATENDGKIFTTIWPHQGDVKYVTKIKDANYKTVLGTMQLVETDGFSTSRTIPNLEFNFSKVSDLGKAIEIAGYIKQDTVQILKDPVAGGVYFKGTWMGQISSLIQLADVYGLTEERNKLLDKLSLELKSSLNEFEYNENLALYVARKPEFGNESGNDHHFHYGYYIRASAVLGMYRPETIEWTKPVISEMVEDIASFDRESTKYPVLRYFSAYEGHSWADGKASFADGNNQESTSEALNAWYSLKMWGDLTSNQKLSDQGTWLFAEELESTSKYWFGKNNPFPEGFTSPIASMVWGGKRDFSTWFSGNPMHIVGIQVLPITPASNYLKSVGNSEQIKSYLNAKVAKPESADWGDLYLMYLSYSDSKLASSGVAVPEKFEGGKLRSLFYQTIYKNAEM
jgi:hypothetical protein